MKTISINQLQNLKRQILGKQYDIKHAISLLLQNNLQSGEILLEKEKIRL